MQNVADDRVLDVRLVLDTHDEPISPAEFLDLFRCGDDFARYIVQNEALVLLEELDIPSGERLATLQRIHGLGRRVPSPAQVESVRKGSWEVLMTIPAAVLVFMLKEYIHPVAKQAWDESDARRRLFGFLKSRVFKDSKRQVEERAITTGRFGNLQVTGVAGETDSSSRPSITIRLERHQVFEVRLTDRELVDEFMKKMSPGK